MIIGISGFINSAKDRAADYLVKCYGFKKESFAGLLKDCVSVVFGWDRVMLEGTTQPSRDWRNQVDPWWAERLGIPHLTPRWVLQHWATEALRDHFHQDIWIAALENKLRNIDYNLVISDCRFPNEIEAIRNQGGKVIWIKRLTPEWYDTALESNLSNVNQMAVKYPDVHRSEWAVLGINFDNIIYNNNDLLHLHLEIDRVANEFGLKRQETKMTYSFQVGDRVYTKPGKRPYRNNLTTFLAQALPLIAAENYTAIVTGRVLYDIKKTTDFDLWLQGPIADYKRLEQLILNLYDIGYNQAELIVDIKWSATESGIMIDPEGNVVNRDAEHISLSYFKLISPTANWEVDRRNTPEYTNVSDWLVLSNYNTRPNTFKPYQTEFVKRYGKIKTVPVEEFIKNLDFYLEPLETPEPETKYLQDKYWIQANNKDLYNIFSQGLDIDYTKAKILDYGCNQGNYVSRAYNTVKPDQYVGIDLNFPSIEIAKLIHPSYKFIHYNKWHPGYNPRGKKDVSLVDFVDTDFDVVIAYSVMTHTTVDQTRKMLEELYQVIKPGGTILFTVWLIDYFKDFYNSLKNSSEQYGITEYLDPQCQSVLYWTDFNTVTTDAEDLAIERCSKLFTFYQREYFEKQFPEAKFVKISTEANTQWLYRIDKPV